MVYVYSRLSKLNEYIGKKLTVDEIKDTLVDLGMDIKGEEEIEGDIELKVEITAEKTDMVSTLGVARAIKYYRGYESKVPKYEIEGGKNKVIVHESASKSRPKTACVILRDLKITDEFLDEMIEIQEKIHDSFGRNRKKVSIGIYPMDEFDFPVTFTAESPEEIKFRPLESEVIMDGNEILLKHDTGKKFAYHMKDLDLYPVFRDSNGEVLSMPPIINSHTTGRVENKHRDLFIEVSGHNLSYLDSIMKVMVTTFIEMGAKAESVKVEYWDGSKYELNLDNYEEKLKLDYVNSLIGIDVNEKEVENLLNKMMYGLKRADGGELVVEVPCFRYDVWHDSDIADDIARGYGYNNVIPKFPNVSSIGETSRFSQFRERVSNSLVSMGFIELYTYILTSTSTQFDKMSLDKENDKKYIRLQDSADQGINMTRVRVLPEILTSLHINRKNKYPQRVFENGFTIQVDDKCDTGAMNEAHLSLAIADPKVSYTDVKAVVDSLIKLVELELEFKENDAIPFLIPGRSGEIFLNGKSVGFIGEVHPKVLDNFGLLVPVVCFELILDDVFN